MSRLIEFNKKLNHYITHARENAKLEYCYYCKKPNPKFCISHSIPKFCLKQISSGKELHTLNSFLKLPIDKGDRGASEAGTFKIICSECDNKIFREYENPDSYNKEPIDQMLAQIALKNYLQLISKRYNELALLDIEQTELGADSGTTNYSKMMKFLDLRDFEADFQRAKLGAIKDRGGWYYLCYYRKLEYQIPLAFQGAITLISDLVGNVINDIFCENPIYRTSQIHVAAFPFSNESVILAFIDSRDSCRYKSFYKQLRKLSPKDQLAVINFVIFGYSENVYVSKSINQGVLENKELISVCEQGIFHRGPVESDERLSLAISDYDFSKRTRIPNLLSEEFCLKP